MLRKFLLTVCFIMFTNAYADSASDTLSTLLKNMHGMQANFKQTIVDKKGKAVQQSSGRMSLQRPGQFRWDVMRPVKQLIVTNGKRLWIFEPDLEQVTIRALSKTAGETPAMLLSDENLSLSKEFIVKTYPSTDKLQWFSLTPKDKSAVIATLKLGFADQVIQQMQLKDHLGHITQIEFSNVKLNPSLSANLFEFKPPAKVDVIDETRR